MIDRAALLRELWADKEALCDLHEAKAIIHKHADRRVGQLAMLLAAEARLHLRLQQVEAAEMAARKAVEITEEAGLGGPERAASLSSLGLVLRYRKRYSKAARLFRRAREIYSKLYGERHPHTSQETNNLAHTVGSREEGIELLKEALEARTQWLGKEHPIVAETLLEMGKVNSYHGKWNLAAPYLQHSLEICRKVLPATRSSSTTYTTSGQCSRNLVSIERLSRCTANRWTFDCDARAMTTRA